MSVADHNAGDILDWKFADGIEEPSEGAVNRPVSSGFPERSDQRSQIRADY